MDKEFILRFRNNPNFSAQDLRHEIISSILQNEEEPSDIISGTLFSLRKNYFNLLSMDVSSHELRDEEWDDLPKGSNFNNENEVYKMIEVCVLASNFWEYIWPKIDEETMTYAIIDGLMKYQSFNFVLSKFYTSLQRCRESVYLLKSSNGLILVDHQINCFLVSNDVFQKLINIKAIESAHGASKRYEVVSNFNTIYQEYCKQELKNKILAFD